VTQEQGKEKEQRSLEVLKEKDAKLQLLQKTEDEFRRRIQELEHKNALQEKDMQIKELCQGRKKSLLYYSGEWFEAYSKDKRIRTMHYIVTINNLNHRD
jgi:hypothetical protein